MTTITSIYIPFVHNNCDENKIKHVFMMLLIGEVERVDFVQKIGTNGNYNMAFVHLNNWFQNTASVNLRERIECGEEARIVYDEPYYWSIYKNRNPVNPQNTEEKLECAFMMIEDLQNRILELEKINIPPPPPRLVRQMATDAGKILISDETFPFN